MIDYEERRKRRDRNSLFYTAILLGAFVWFIASLDIQWTRTPRSLEDYSINAPYTFANYGSPVPLNQIHVYALRNCTPANRQIEKVVKVLPENIRVIYHDIGNSTEATQFLNLAKHTGKQSAFKGPVFFFRKQIFFYSDDIKEHVKAAI